MSKIILGIKDDYRPMRIIGFEGSYSAETELLGYNCREIATKITLETYESGMEFKGFKDALNYIYGCGRSRYQRDINALGILEKSLKTNSNNFRINHHMFGISKVISHDPATIVFWKDGTKTVVKCQEGDAYDLEKGILYAIIRKVYGEGRNYTDVLNVIDESCENYNNEKAKEESNESTNTI